MSQISLKSNLLASNVRNQLNKTSAELSDSVAKLASGARIAKPSDDPAGHQLAEALQRDARIASVAVRNANDGVSLSAIVDAGLGEISSLLVRMAELSEQSANGAFTQTQRSALSLEFTALGSEIERIAVTTEFNGKTLLYNSEDVTLQVGLDSSADSRITLNSALGTLASLGLASTGSSALNYSVIDTTSTASIAASELSLSAVRSAIDQVSSRRGNVGAQESRLSHAISNLQVMRENYVAAESRIRDVDAAEEIAKFVRLQVLQQSNVALLAQANQAPGTALQLIQGANIF